MAHQHFFLNKIMFFYFLMFYFLCSISGLEDCSPLLCQIYNASLWASANLPQSWNVWYLYCDQLEFLTSLTLRLCGNCCFEKKWFPSKSSSLKPLLDEFIQYIKESVASFTQNCRFRFAFNAILYQQEEVVWWSPFKEGWEPVTYVWMGDTTVEGRSTPGNLTEVLDIKTRFLGIHLLF